MRTLSRPTLVLLAAVVSVQAAFAQGPAWRDSTRDEWIHPELGIPVRGQVVGGLEYVLTNLELAPTPTGS